MYVDSAENCKHKTTPKIFQRDNRFMDLHRLIILSQENVRLTLSFGCYFHKLNDVSP